MTERIKGCWVAFDNDLREDDAQPLLAAIRQLRGVQAVTTTAANAEDWMIRSRVRHELIAKIMEII